MSPMAGAEEDGLTPGERVRLARENLCLAMALFAASHRGLLTVGLLPPGAELRRSDDDGDGDGVVVPAGAPPTVSDQRSLVRSAGNQVRGAFALSALQTQRELAGVYGAGCPLSEPDDGLRAGRAVIGLIARSLERSLFAPRWQVPAGYRQSFAIAGLGFACDAAGLDGVEMRWEHFGGLPGYLDLTLFLSRCLDGAGGAAALGMAASGDYGMAGQLAAQPSWEVPADAPFDAGGAGLGRGGYGSGSGRRRYGVGRGDGAGGGSTGWIAPAGPPEPPFAIAGQASQPGPVDDFVAAACATGEQAMVLAGDLYTAYARWCLDNGYLAHSQRKFGLELTARGYQRKRRGKGRHWWLGVAARPF